MESELKRKKKELTELQKEEAKLKAEIEKKKESETLDIAIEAQRRRNEYLERQALSPSCPQPTKQGSFLGTISKGAKQTFKSAEGYLSTHDVARGLKDEEKKKVRK